jgi:uncharacterized membrane protein YdfJ with MMPL/SSD domain
LTASSNIAARMGRWSAQHRKIAIFGWLAFVVGAFVIGNAIGTKELRSAELGVGESGRMMKLLDKEFPEPAGERVLVQSPALTARDTEFKAVVADVVRRLEPQKDVINIRSPLDEENFNLVSDDGHSALVDFQIAGDVDAATDKVQPIVDSVAAAQAAHPRFVVEQFGDASVEKEFEETFLKDLERAGFLSVPLTLIILIVAFGSLVAAGIPLLLALSAVLATVGLIAIPSQLLAVDAQGVTAVVLLIGLAVGVDYSMFYLKREREERAAGNHSDSALQAAAATSGRSVLISGVTVMIAMAGMFFTGDRTFMGMTAESRDFNDQMASSLPIVFAFVLGLAFLLMLLTFRSIVIAFKAIVMNLLSVAAAYGVLVLVFQHGYGKNLLDFDYTGGVQSFLPVFLFVILFGLSMDYHVFILSRIREGYDNGLATADAIAHGIKVTAGTVTSAAVAMVGVFAIFGTLPVIFLKQFGVGLAVAVLLDATIVRAVLLPATMRLLGEWNWYLPTWLEWLPRLERAEPVPDPAVVPAGR